MQFTTVTALFLSLFAAQALACGTPDEQCNSPNAVDCQCNGGNLVSCQVRGAGQPGYVWKFYGDCPPNGGGLSCVNGKCAISA